MEKKKKPASKKRFTFADAKSKIQELDDKLKQEIKDKKLAIDMLENKGNKDTVTSFQLIGWSSSALVVGILIGALSW